MHSDHRQSQRHSDFIPVSVTTLNSVTGRGTAGPLSGRIINISRNGACLLLPPPPANPEIAEMPDAPGARDRTLLEIRGARPGKATTFTLTARRYGPRLWSWMTCAAGRWGWSSSTAIPARTRNVFAPAPSKAMSVEQRRSKRYDRFLPITVSALAEGGNTVKAGPFQGRIINISRHGACLLMSQVMASSFHIYYSIKETPSSFLQLTINIQPEIIDCRIMGQPVWMDVFREGEIRAFKIGVAFLGNADDEQMLHLEQVISRR